MPPPPPRLAAALLLLLLLAVASAQLPAGPAADADGAQVGTVADDGLLEGPVNESPIFTRRRRPSGRRTSSPAVVGPVVSGATTFQPTDDAVDSQGTTSPAPLGRPPRPRGRASRRNSRNRTSSYAPVSRTPQHNYALRGNYESRTATETGLTRPLSFSATTDSILAQATTEGYEHITSRKAVPTAATAEPVIARNNENENFYKRSTESPLSIDLSVALRFPEPSESGQAHIAKNARRGSLSSGATVSGFDSLRTSPRAAGVRSLFGRRSKHRSTLQPEQFRSRSTSHTTAEIPLTETEQLDGHTRATRENDVPETTTPQVDATTPAGRRRLVSVARRRRPIDTATEATVSTKKDEGDQRPIVRVQKRRRPATIDTATDSAVPTTEPRASTRKTRVYKRRRPISTSVATPEPSLLEEDASGNQRGYRRVRPSSPQQEAASEQASATNGEKYQFSVQSSSKSEEAFVGGRRKPVGKVRVRGRRPLLSHSEPGVGSSEKAVGGDGRETVLTTTTTEILPETASEVPEYQATPSTSTTIEASTSRRVLARTRRPLPTFRRAVTPSIAPLIQAEPVSHTNPSSLPEESSTAESPTTPTPIEKDENTTDQTTEGSTKPATILASNLPSTQITVETTSENEGGLSKKISPKFGRAKGRLPGRRVNLGSKYSNDQRKTTPEANAVGLTSVKIKSSTLNATGEKPTGHTSDRLVKSRTLNSLRNRKPTSLLRRNNVSNGTEAPTAANISFVGHTVEDENLATVVGESTPLPKPSVEGSFITTETPVSSTVKGKGRLKKTKIPLTPRRTKGPSKLPVQEKLSANSTEEEANETSSVPDTGTLLKGRKPTSLDKLLKTRRPLPVLLRKSQNKLASPAPEIVESSDSNSEASTNSTLPSQADVTPGQTTVEEFDTTTATVPTSPLQTNTENSSSNIIRKLPKGFKPPRFRPTIGKAIKTQVDVTPGQTTAEEFDTTTAAVATSPLQTNTDNGSSNILRKQPKGFKPSRFRPTIGKAIKTQVDVTPGQTTAEEFDTTTPTTATSALQTNTDNGSSNSARKLPKGFKPSRFRPTIGKARKTQTDVTTGQTTADEFDTTTAATATSPLETNTDNGLSNSIRKLPKGFKPSRFRPTVGEARKTRIKDTPGQRVRDRPRFTPLSTIKKGGRPNISAGNGTQSTAPLKTGLFNNRKPFTGLKSPFLKSAGRFNTKPADSEDEDTEIPTVAVQETTEAYSDSPKVEDNVIEDLGSNTSSKVDDEVQEMSSNRPIVTTVETVTFQAQNTTQGNGVENVNPLVSPSLSPLEESGSTTRKTFVFPSVRGRGNEKNSKLKSLQKLLSVLRQKSNSGVVSTTVNLDTETENFTPEVPSEFTTDSVDGHPPNQQNTISQTEISVLEGDDRKAAYTTEESKLTTVMETTVLPVVPEEEFIPSEISENHGNSFVPLSVTTEVTTFSPPEKSDSEDSPTVATKIFEAETETTYPETTTVSGRRLVLKGSDSIDNGNTAVNTSEESVRASESTSSLVTGTQLRDEAISIYANNVSAETTESSLSATERMDEVLSTLVSTTEVQDQSTTMVYEETVTVTEPSTTFQVATQSIGSTVSEVWTDPRNTASSVANESHVPESGGTFVSLTDIVLHNLTEAISQLSNEIDSVYTDTNVTSELTSVTTLQNATGNTEQTTHASLELNTSIGDTVLTTESSMATGAMNAATVPQQLSTTSEITAHADLLDSDTTIRTTVENTHSVVVKEIELSTETTAVPEETTVLPSVAVNVETVTQQLNSTFEFTTSASTEDSRATVVNIVENTHRAVVEESEFPTATTVAYEETTVPFRLDLEQSITSNERDKLLTEIVPTDETLATTEIPDFGTGITSGMVTEVYEAMATQTERPNSKENENKFSGESSLPTTEENRSNTGTFLDESLIDISDNQTELDSSFSRGTTHTVTTVEFRTAGTTIAPEMSTTAIASQEPRESGEHTQSSTTENLETHEIDVSTVTPNSDTHNNGNNSYEIKDNQGASLSSTSEEEQENLTTESSESDTTEATAYRSHQSVTIETVTEQVTERETLEPSTPKTSHFIDSATSDSNSVLDYETVTDPVTVITEVFATDSWLTVDGALSTTVLTNTPEENDLKANEINFNDSLYNLPTTQAEDVTLPSERLTPAKTDSSVTTTTESNFHATGSSISSSEEMASYSSIPDTASAENGLPEDKDTPSSTHSTTPAFIDSAATTVSFLTDSDNQVPVKTTFFTYFGDETTTEGNSISDDLLENYAASDPFQIQAVSSHGSILDENNQFYKETTISPVTDPLLISTENENDKNETDSVGHPAFVSTGRTTVDYDTTFLPTVTVAYPLNLETVDGVASADIQLSNTEKSSREVDDVVAYQDIERNAMYTDVPTSISTDSVQPSTPLLPSNCTGHMTERTQNNCTVIQDIVTGFTDASSVDTDNTKSPSPDSEGNDYQLLLTEAATESQTEDGMSTYWTESFESEAADSLVTREDKSLTSDTKEIRDSSFSDSSTDYIKVDDESLHENGSGFAALNAYTLAPS